MKTIIDHTATTPYLSQIEAIETSFGCLAWQWRWNPSAKQWQLCRTSLGHKSCRSARNAIANENPAASIDYETDGSLPELPQGFGGLLIDWANGEVVDFHDVPIAIPRATPFRWSVTRACRKIPSGKVVTYGELARRVGRPGAARAVGRVMATNPLPIVVPCHRVVASGGAMRGFSAVGGIATKQRMLAIENVCDSQTAFA